MLSPDSIIGYQLFCHNEWCSGPEKWGFVEEKPEEPQNCPTCGWSAMYGSGIKEVLEESNYG